MEMQKQSTVHRRKYTLIPPHLQHGGHLDNGLDKKSYWAFGSCIIEGHRES